MKINIRLRNYVVLLVAYGQTRGKVCAHIAPNDIMPAQLAFKAQIADLQKGIIAEPQVFPSAGLAYKWHTGKTIYRFDADVYASLVKQPLAGTIPTQALLRLPLHAFYVVTPGLTLQGEKVVGFAASLDTATYDAGREATSLQLIWWYDKAKQPMGETDLPIIDGTLEDMFEHMQRVTEAMEAKRRRKAKYSWEMPLMHPKEFIPILNLILYLCSDNVDINPEQTKPHRKTSSGAAPRETRTVDVGLRIGSAIRKAQNERVLAEQDAEANEDITNEKLTDTSEKQARKKPIAHIRSAHWHHFWRGAADDRQLVLRWLPPIAVNVDVDDAMPTVVRLVK